MKRVSVPILLRVTLLVGLAGLPVRVLADRIAAVARVVPEKGLIELESSPGDLVSEVLVREGAVVAVGEPLLRLQSIPLAMADLKQAELTLRELREQQPLALRQAEIAVEQARAEAEFARRTLARDEAGDLGRLAPQVLDQHAHGAQIAQLRVESVEAALAATRLAQPAALARAEAAVAAARLRVERGTLSAPTGGTILQVDAVPGAATGRGRPLVILADLTQMVVIGDVFEGDLARVSVGQTARITSKSLTAPLQGKVVHVGRIIAGAGKTGRVTVNVEDAEALTHLLNAEVDLMIE